MSYLCDLLDRYSIANLLTNSMHIPCRSLLLLFIDLSFAIQRPYHWKQHKVIELLFSLQNTKPLISNSLFLMENEKLCTVKGLKPRYCLSEDTMRVVSQKDIKLSANWELKVPIIACNLRHLHNVLKVDIKHKIPVRPTFRKYRQTTGVMSISKN